MTRRWPGLQKYQITTEGNWSSFRCCCISALKNSSTSALVLLWVSLTSHSLKVLLASLARNGLLCTAAAQLSRDIWIKNHQRDFLLTMWITICNWQARIGSHIRREERTSPLSLNGLRRVGWSEWLSREGREMTRRCGEVGKGVVGFWVSQDVLVDSCSHLCACRYL